ncbi:MAG: UbiA family prenyltransferase, partial [Nitrospira sp.]|nr:UbiA family prenyltransferase [Nitrospira sp.]
LLPEAWYIGLIMGLFLMGATTTKDFSDIEGDEAYQIRTLPVAYGPNRAAKMVAPFICLPFLLIPAGGLIGVLTPPDGRWIELLLLGLGLSLWGAWVAGRIIIDTEELTKTENHPAWRHMYYLMILSQVGFVAVYMPTGWVRDLIGDIS